MARGKIEVDGNKLLMRLVYEPPLQFLAIPQI